MTPTQRTLKRLRELGYTAEVVERWNHYAQVRQDLFGFVDIVACGMGEPLRFIQATSASNHAARERKIESLPVAREIATAPGAIVYVWSWGKKGARGKVKSWTLRATAWTPRANGWQDLSKLFGEPA